MELCIGNTIFAARHAKGLTQEALAAQIGVSAAAVSKWETAASYPDITLLPPLARALGLTVDALLDFHPAPSNEELHQICKRLRTIFDKQGFPPGSRKLKLFCANTPPAASLKLWSAGCTFTFWPLPFPMPMTPSKPVKR